jgi:hypothetical protein
MAGQTPPQLYHVDSTAEILQPKCLFYMTERGEGTNENYEEPPHTFNSQADFEPHCEI